MYKVALGATKKACEFNRGLFCSLMTYETNIPIAVVTAYRII